MAGAEEGEKAPWKKRVPERRRMSERAQVILCVCLRLGTPVLCRTICPTDVATGALSLSRCVGRCVLSSAGTPTS